MADQVDGKGAPGAAAGLRRHAALLAVVAALVFVGAVRARLADTPLERDEGEYAYVGAQVKRGIPPYERAWNMKFPGTYYAYAAVMSAFGETPRGIRLGLLAVNAATTLLLFALARRVLRPAPAAVAAILFAVLALDRGVLGAFAHATHFLTFFAVAGLALLLRSLAAPVRPARLVAAGALLGLAVLMKQHGAAFALLGVALAAASAREGGRWAPKSAAVRAACVGAGVTLPLAIVAAVLAAQGVFEVFWFWTVVYGSQYASVVTLQQVPVTLGRALRSVTDSALSFWLMAGVGLVLLFARRGAPGRRSLVGGLVAAGVLATIPGFFFRDHYFVVLLPALALLGGVAVQEAGDAIGRRLRPAIGLAIAVTLPALLVLAWAVAERNYLFRVDGVVLSRATYGGNPFVESPEIARHIRENTAPGDRIAVLGSEPQLYFYAGREAATGYLYTYPLMEPQPYAQQMQRHMAAEIEAARPAYIVLVEVRTSWLVRPSSDQWILRWGLEQLEKCYLVEGIAEAGRLPPVVRWGEAARNQVPSSTSLVWVYRRDSGRDGCGGS